MVGAVDGSLFWALWLFIDTFLLIIIFYINNLEIVS